MKNKIIVGVLVSLMALSYARGGVPSGWLRGDGFDTPIGLSKDEALKILGNAEKILGPADGYQTYDYHSQGFGVVFCEGKVVQVQINTGSEYKTRLGIGIGSDISEVTKAYGDTKRQEEVKEWFGGLVPNVLYHHPEFDKYKINYPDKNYIFFFDADKKVECFEIGYIYPIEEDKAKDKTEDKAKAKGRAH